MKFIHLADCHIGDSLSFDRSLSNKIRENKKKSFENILKNNKDLDFLLIAGDLYERSYFTISDYKELFSMIEGFTKDVFYVTGNHDYIGKEDDLINLLKPDNLHLYSTDEIEYYQIENTRIYGISYSDRVFYKDFSYDISLDDDFFNILLVHATVNDKRSNYLNLNLEKLKNIGFDYVGLGHIHKWEDLGSRVYYSGSIEPSDFSDIYDYGYLLYENGEIYHKDSSIMKFYDINLSMDDYKNENDLISYLKTKLDSKKEKYLRLRIDKNINKNKLKEQLNLERLEIYVIENDSVFNLIDLYPNSLLTKYIGKFPDKLDTTEKLALDIGLDAIYRSKND